MLIYILAKYYLVFNIFSVSDDFGTYQSPKNEKNKKKQYRGQEVKISILELFY